MIIDNDNDFALEDFLNSEMEHSRMTPSASVWDKISKEVHPTYRWSIYVLTALLLFVPYSLIMNYIPAKNSSITAETNIENNSTTGQSAIPTIASANTRFNKLNKVRSSFEGGNLNANDIVAIENSMDNNTLGNNINEANRNASEHNGVSDIESADKTPMSLPELSNTTLPETIASVNTTKIKVDNKVGGVVAPIHKKSSSKFALEVYATPSISYRNLSDDKTRLQYYRDIYRNNPFTTDIAAKNVNTVVNQTPLMGKEIGVEIIYAINSRWKLKMGLQFDVREYATEAYQSNGISNIVFLNNLLMLPRVPIV